MKSVIALSFFVITIISISLSCKKNNDPSPTGYTKPDSIAFGRYNSMSMTPVPHGQFYELENNALYAYPILFIPAGTQMLKQKLPDSLYLIARYLIDNFPSYLMQHPKDSSIGCPGCTDEQIITLSVLSDTTTRGWLISTDTSRLPVELRQYIWKAGMIMDQL